MEELIRKPELRYRLAENGLRLVREEYNWDVMRRRLVDTMESIIG